MRVILAASLAALGLALIATAPAQAATVRIGDNYFSPKRLSVPQHTILKFRWVGHRRHNVKVRRGPVHWRSPTQRTGQFLQHLWTKGTYKLVCTLHPDQQRMTLTVT